MGRFDGQVVVVTGAGGGLGRAHALLLAAEGASVLVNDYGGDPHGTPGDPATAGAVAGAVVDEIRAAGGMAEADTSDVATEGGAIVDHALDAFGGLHAVINNAGTANGGTLETIPPADYDRLLAIHLGGTIAVSRAAWPVFRRQGYGRIVNTSSASVFGLGGTSAYVTAKAAIVGLTRATALDGTECGIKVNAIMPGAYSRLTARSTDFAALLQAGFPAERVSPFVGALVSADCPCTGETFVVGGGRAARVVLGTVPGLVGFDSIGDCLARFDEAMDSTDVHVPTNALTEVAYECAHLGIDLSGLGRS